MMNKNLPCPCGHSKGKRPLAYKECCGPYIEHFESCPAPDAISLMRSRYSAFVLQNAAYLQSTWDPGSRPATLDFDPHIKWLELQIRDSTQPAPDYAEVEFVARSRIQGKGQRLHERSRFVNRDGRWFYVDGEIFE